MEETMAAASRNVAEEEALQAYEIDMDLIYADKDNDLSFQERILQGAREFFNIKAIEHKEAPTMENSDYYYFNHYSNDKDE
jgi:hypothetical protein